MQAFLFVTPAAICMLGLFAAGELIVRDIRRQNLWLALIYFVYALVLLRAFLLFSDWMPAVPFLYESTLWANFCIGPLSYYFIRAALALDGEAVAPNEAAEQWDRSGREMERRLFSDPRRIRLQFIPGLLALLVVIPNLFEPAAVTVRRYAAAMDWFEGGAGNLPRDLYALLTPLALFHVAIYLALIIRETVALLKPYNLRRQASVRAFLVMSVIALVSTACAFGGIAGGNRTLVEFAIGLLALVAPLMYLFEKRYPDLFEVLGDLLRVEREKIRARYIQSHLSGVDVEELERRLAELMEVQCVYRRDDLSLPVLAELLESTPHRLSEYLNKIRNASFSDYINRRRIIAARELLLKRPEETVLSIGYEVGFNSKSAFNKAFVRFTGLSPTRFRKAGERNAGD